MTKPGCFNLEKFRKIASKLNTPERIKTLAEFRVAIGELTESQSRFCDRFIDAGEYDEAHSECAKIRIDLGMAFEQCGETEQDVEKLNATIDWLFERMTMLETVEVEADSAGGEMESSLPQPLALSRLVFWIGLPLFVLLYAVACWIAGHLLTASEWSSPAAFLGWSIPVGLSAGLLLYVYRESLPGTQTSFMRWCVKGMASVKVMLWAVFVVLCAWFFAYLCDDKYRPAFADDLVANLVLGIVPPLWCVVALRLWTRGFGWTGFLVKAALIIDAIGFSLLTGYLCDAPFGQHPFKPVEHWHSILCLAVFYCLLISDTFMAFVMKREISRSLVLIPAMSIILTAAFLMAERTHRPPETQAQVEQRVPVPVVHPPHRRTRKHQVHPASLPVYLQAGSPTPVYSPALSPVTRIQSFFRQKVTSGREKIASFFYAYWPWGVAVLYVAASAVTGKKKPTIEDARRDAHGISGPNVYGAAGLAARKIAKNRGWL